MSATIRRRADRLLPTTRFMLAAGFGGVLAVMALSGVDALRVLHQIRREDDQIRRQFLYRNHVLNDIRSQLYLSGTYVRDYLLEPDAAKAEAHRASLEQVRREMSSALASYADQATPGGAPQFASLKSELSQYWDTLGPALKWSAAERHGRGYAFLRDEVFPRRTAMLGIAGRIAEVNEEQLNAGNDRVVGLLSRFQTRLGLVLVATLALGVGMSAFSMRRILSLETGAREQYRDVAQARGQLKELSARLVQAQESERRALSRELHDEVGQALSAVLVELRNLADGLGAWSLEMSRSHVKLIKGLVENTVRAVECLMSRLGGGADGLLLLAPYTSAVRRRLPDVEVTDPDLSLSGALDFLDPALGRIDSGQAWSDGPDVKVEGSPPLWLGTVFGGWPQSP